MFKFTTWLIATGLTSPAHTLDCGKVRNSTEKLICAAPTLIELDDRINTFYRALMMKVPPDLKQKLRGEQRAQIARRDTCQPSTNGKSGGCYNDVLSAMSDNLRALDAWVKIWIFSDPMVMDDAKMRRFSEAFDRRRSFEPQHSVQEDGGGSSHLGCSEYSCRDVAFEWTAKNARRLVRAVAKGRRSRNDACSDENSFYVLGEQLGREFPEDAIAPLKAWAEWSLLCPKNALWFDSRTKQWKPLRQVGSTADGAARKIDEAVSKSRNLKNRESRTTDVPAANVNEALRKKVEDK